MYINQYQQFAQFEQHNQKWNNKNKTVETWNFSSRVLF